MNNFNEAMDEAMNDMRAFLMDIIMDDKERGAHISVNKAMRDGITHVNIQQMRSSEMMQAVKDGAFVPFMKNTESYNCTN